MRRILGMYRLFSSTTGTCNLLDQIRARIRMEGPLSVAEYMKEVLTNTTSGYYMKRDVFGAKGDFITSPEISQVFGELLGVWCINEWLQAGSPDHMQLVELGPGRGTLVHDMLRVFGQFPETKRISLHLVEVSPILSKIQCRTLTGADAELMMDSVPYMQARTTTGINVSWYRHLTEVPPGFSCFLAHEFFDALPVYKFKRTERGWREVMITIDPLTKDLAFMLASGPTPASRTYISKLSPLNSSDQIEVSPASGVVVKQLCEKIETNGGMALIADYGHYGDKGDTFRAFRKHKLHNPLVAPGYADLTADVDFNYLRRNLTNKVVSFGPISQSDFLHNMGIGLRIKVLHEKATSAQRKDLITAYHMMTDRDKMGERFKFFSIFSSNNRCSDCYIPAGFGSG